jgi:hypothetical protein
MYLLSFLVWQVDKANTQDQHAMSSKLETKIRQRADEMWERENHPTADQRWSDAEHEVTVEAENAAISRWAAPVSGTYVEKSNETARAAEKVRETDAAACKSEAEQQERLVTPV